MKRTNRWIFTATLMLIASIAALLAACSGGSDGGGNSGSAVANSTTPPLGTPATSAKNIKHVFVIMLETTVAPTLSTPARKTLICKRPWCRKAPC